LNFVEWIVIFSFIWGIFNRLQEIAQWPDWKSKFGPWFDTVNEIGNKWWPFRDAYHTFKGLSIYFLCILVGIFFGWTSGIYMYTAWAFGQFLGKLTKRR
jgi:hypothetical protein